MKSFLVMAAAAATAVALLAPTSTQAVCPDSVCDCLGEAKNFDAIANEKMTVSFGKISASGSSYRVETEIQGNICSSLLNTVGGSADEAPTTVGSVVGRLGPTFKAVKFKGVRVYGYLDPGVDVAGDVVTGGGLVVSPELAIVDGVIDTSGTHPLYDACTQAQSDLAAAAATLAALTPTQTHDQILAKGGEAEVTVINTVPGLNVIQANEVKVAPQSVSGYPEGSELSIDMDENATMVVINTGKFKVGKQCLVTVSGPGADPSKVVINVTLGNGVVLSQESIVEVPILATQSALTVGAGVESSAVFGRKVTIKGSAVAGDVCSPSGAFIDGESPLF